MNLIIDAHLDLAYSALSFGRNYHLSSAEIRALESQMHFAASPGQCVLGYPDFRRGGVALVCSTLFASPHRYIEYEDEKIYYRDAHEARVWFEKELKYYAELSDSSLGHFRIVRSKAGLKDLFVCWEKSLAHQSENNLPVGIILLLEGAEALGDLAELEDYWRQGVRIVGPVWAGIRFCGGTYEHGGFTAEGYRLLEMMADLGMILDIAHMTDRSAQQALDKYPGGVIASHANSRKVLRGELGERHLTDEVIKRLAMRDGVIGVIPGNSFLRPGWKRGDDRRLVTLNDLIAHIDHICQIAGDARHVGIGTDFDGGFGYPAIPLEMQTIADLQKLEPELTQRGYSPEDIAAIFHGNFRRCLEAYLPEE
ncbi:MAG: peptidase M19 [Anaerolineae bacterium]|nr:peptidase M19 [Anaerolineae bacterium]